MPPMLVSVVTPSLPSWSMAYSSSFRAAWTSTRGVRVRSSLVIEYHISNGYRRDLAGWVVGRGRRVGGRGVAPTKTVQLMRASTVIDSMVSDSTTKDAEIDSWKP